MPQVGNFRFQFFFHRAFICGVAFVFHLLNPVPFQKLFLSIVKSSPADTVLGSDFIVGNSLNQHIFHSFLLLLLWIARLWRTVCTKLACSEILFIPISKCRVLWISQRADDCTLAAARLDIELYSFHMFLECVHYLPSCPICSIGFRPHPLYTKARSVMAINIFIHIIAKKTAPKAYPIPETAFASVYAVKVIC